MDEFEFFREAYRTYAPWDIGRPQSAFAELADAGLIKGSVLEVGCGTGENAMLAARLGHQTWGIDAVEEALKKARAKAKARGLKVTFKRVNALDLGELGRTFDTIIDSGLFHAFDDDERQRYVKSLAQALKPGGLYHMLCFNEHVHREGGPRRVTQAEIRQTFQDGWRVKEIRPSHFDVQDESEGVPAWLSTIERLP